MVHKLKAIDKGLRKTGSKVQNPHFFKFLNLKELTAIGGWNRFGTYCMYESEQFEGLGLRS